MSEQDAVPGDGRDETSSERADRKWNDMLQELRVVQTGAQLTAGFLLTLPFQETFWDRLSRGQHIAYLALLVRAAVITALVMTPVAIHRRLSGQQVKARLVDASGRIVQVVLALMALLIVGIAAFVFNVVVGLGTSLAVGGLLLVLLVIVLVVVPRRLVA